jgi:hypothetical protein
MQAPSQAREGLMRDTPDMDEDEEDNDTDPWGEPDEYD